MDEPRGRQPAGGGGPERGRFTAGRAQEGGLRLSRGEPLETVSREVGVTAAPLPAWRDQCLAGGAAALTSRQPDPKDEQVGGLPAEVGDLTMGNGLLAEQSARQAGERPFPRRRARP